MTSTTGFYGGPKPADLACIPDVLKALPQWVLFQVLEVPDTHGELKLTKIPINASTLTNAATNAPKTWYAFTYCAQRLPVALATWQETPPTQYKGKPATYQGGGIGFVFTAADPFMLVDLDHSLDQTGTVAPWARDIVDTLQSYTQKSVSGTGLHVLLQAHVPADAKQHGDVQMWHEKRFVAMTGWHLEGTPQTIEARQSALTLVHAAHVLKPRADAHARTAAPRPPTPRPLGLDDTAILAKARAAQNSAKFAALWEGETSGYGGDDSAADEALCCELAFWTRDPSQIDRLFRASGLMRDKWNEKRGKGTYGECTIGQALETVTTSYEPEAWKEAQIAAKQHRNGDTPTGREPPLPYSDYTNALAFVRDHGEDLRYCYPWKAWLTWTGTHWQRDSSGEVMRLAKQTVKRLARRVETLDEKEQVAALMAHIKASLSTAKLKAMVECAQSEPGIAVQPDALDSHLWLLNCTNGTLDLRTGVLREHAHDDLLTRCLAIPYEPEAPCPTFLGFLETATQGNAEVMAFINKALGYSLTGSTREQCLFLVWGRTKTGKSTFINIVKAVLGPYGTQAEMSAFLHKDRETVRNDLADLAGMRLVCAIETDEGKRLAEALIKQLTGGTDTIKARFLFEEYFEYRPQFKIFLATNHKPKVNAADDAIWERIHLIPFAVQIPKDQRDKELEAKLRAELPGILAWVVQGCLAWQQVDGLGEPEVVVKATQGYRKEMDTVGRFLEECCVIDPHKRVKASDLYNAYKTWCETTGGRWVSLTAMGKQLDEKGFTKKVSDGVWRLGVGLLTATDDDRS